MADATKMSPVLGGPSVAVDEIIDRVVHTHTHCCGQDRCDKTFVLLMRAPRCNHGRRY